MSDTRSSLSSCRNSSLSTSSTKCFRMYFSAAFLSSSHPWVSANALIPKQLEGSNCSSRKSQQAFCTPVKESEFNSISTHQIWMTQIVAQIQRVGEGRQMVAQIQRVGGGQIVAQIQRVGGEIVAQIQRVEGGQIVAQIQRMGGFNRMTKIL